MSARFDVDDHVDHHDDVEHDVDRFDGFDHLDFFGAEAVDAEFVAAVVEAAGEGEGEEEVGEEVEGFDGCLGRDVDQEEGFEVVWVAWCWWGAVCVESDVFVVVAGAGAVGGPEFFY